MLLIVAMLEVAIASVPAADVPPEVSRDFERAIRAAVDAAPGVHRVDEDAARWIVRGRVESLAGGLLALDVRAEDCAGHAHRHSAVAARDELQPFAVEAVSELLKRIQAAPGGVVAARAETAAQAPVPIAEIPPPRREPVPPPPVADVPRVVAPVVAPLKPALPAAALETTPEGRTAGYTLIGSGAVVSVVGLFLFADRPNDAAAMTLATGVALMLVGGVTSAIFGACDAPDGGSGCAGACRTGTPGNVSVIR